MLKKAHDCFAGSLQQSVQYMVQNAGKPRNESKFYTALYIHSPVAKPQLLKTITEISSPGASAV